MKIKIRKPNIKKSLKVRTSGRIKKTVKKSINPLYGKKGIDYLKNPERAVRNKVYHKTSIGVSDIIKNPNKKSKSNIMNKYNSLDANDIDYLAFEGVSESDYNNFKKTIGKNIILILLLFVSIIISFFVWQVMLLMFILIIMFIINAVKLMKYRYKFKKVKYQQLTYYIFKGQEYIDLNKLN